MTAPNPTHLHQLASVVGSDAVAALTDRHLIRSVHVPTGPRPPIELVAEPTKITNIIEVDHHGLALTDPNRKPTYPVSTQDMGMPMADSMRAIRRSARRVASLSRRSAWACSLSVTSRSTERWRPGSALATARYSTAILRPSR